MIDEQTTILSGNDQPANIMPRHVEAAGYDAARTVEDSVAMGTGAAAAIAREIGRNAEAAAGDAEQAYETSADQARDQLSDLMSSYSIVMDGAQEFQRVFWDAFQHSLQATASGPVELMQCRNVTEFAETQRELFRKGVDAWVDTNRRLLDISGRIAEDAMRPVSGADRA